MHFNVLYDAVAWARSAARQLCTVCRRSKDPEFTLLCDECNRGYHTYCLKPKLKDIPEGDWFCPKCRPENYVVRRANRRKIFTEEEDEDRVPSRRPSVEEKAARKTGSRKRLNETTDADDSQDEVPLASVRSVAGGGGRSSKTPKIEVSAPQQQVSPRKRNRPNWRKLLESDDDEETDDEPLVKKRKAKSSGQFDVDDEEPLQARVRRSRQDEDKPAKTSRKTGRRTQDYDDNLTLHASILYNLLDDISKHECSWPFNRPVTLKEVPDYYEIIKNPMDFAKIKSQLNMGYYKTDYDLMNDIQLVFANCDLYNNSESEIYQ